MGETTPSENEWLIMEVLWKSNLPLTSTDVIEQLKGMKEVSQKTIRVMINRLLQKGILDYTVDQKDARIYHYYPVKSKEACRREKSERFISSYFGGNTSLAAATFLKEMDLTQEQIKELEEVLYLHKAKQSGSKKKD